MGVHFIVSNSNELGDGISSLDTVLFDHYEKPDGYRACRLTARARSLRGGYMDSSECVFRALSPDTDTAAEARNAILTGVQALGGLKARWRKQRLIAGGDHAFRTSLCYVLEVEPAGHDGVPEAQGILSFDVAKVEEEGDDCATEGDDCATAQAPPAGLWNRDKTVLIMYGAAGGGVLARQLFSMN